MENRYDFINIEKKWRAEWEKNPINLEDDKAQVLLPGYVPVSFRYRPARWALEGLCAERCC